MTQSPLHDDYLIRQWVERELEALDQHRSERNWRYRALGETVADVMADLPRTREIRLVVPVAQARVLVERARAADLTASAYVRRAVALKLMADGVDRADIPYWTQ